MTRKYIHVISLIAVLIVIVVRLWYQVLNAEYEILVIPEYSKWPDEVRAAARTMVLSQPTNRYTQLTIIYDYLNATYNKKDAIIIR